MTMPPGDYPDPMTQEVDLGYQRGWDDAMAEKPPCACGGEVPLAVVEARCYKDDRTLNGLHHNLDACFLHHEGACEPVRVLVFDLPGEKPCS